LDIVDDGTDISIHNIPYNFYTDKYNAPSCVMDIGYSFDDRNKLLISLDLGEDYDLLEDKCIEVYNWLRSDKFIKY
jgi:hypothetical protein